MLKRLHTPACGRAPGRVAVSPRPVHHRLHVQHGDVCSLGLPCNLRVDIQKRRKGWLAPVAAVLVAAAAAATATATASLHLGRWAPLTGAAGKHPHPPCCCHAWHLPPLPPATAPATAHLGHGDGKGTAVVLAISNTTAVRGGQLLNGLELRRASAAAAVVGFCCLCPRRRRRCVPWPTAAPLLRPRAA